jgi:hypothetical protein
MGLIEAVSANTCAGHPRSALTTQSFRPRSLWVVLANPADAETDLAVGIGQDTSLIGRFLYASMAAFESNSLRRSPRFILQAMLSKRNREVSLYSPSSPVLSRTLHAMLKDCSNSSVSVMHDNFVRSEAFPHTGG